MIEFLRPRDQLQQVFLIEPRATIQAIAAAIYADWITGVDYKKCPVCRDPFEVNKARPWQEYCSAKCKGTARMRRYRNPEKGAKTPPRKRKKRSEKHDDTAAGRRASKR